MPVKGRTSEGSEAKRTKRKASQSPPSLEGMESAGQPIGRYAGPFAYLLPLVVLIVLRICVGFHISDDAYISLKVVSNLVGGHGMTFNLGEANYAASSPLWILLISATRVLTGDLIAMKALTIVCESLLVLVMVHLCRGIPYGRRVGAVAAILLVTNPVFLLTSASGLELSLFLLVVLLAVDLLHADRFTLALAVGALAVWVRIEGAVLFVVIASWVFLCWNNRTLKADAAGLVLRYLPSLAIMGGYLLFGLYFHGSVFPAGAW